MANTNAPDETPQSAVPDSDIVDYLKVEVEHFYRAEIQSEQRANWLLTIASGALAIVLNSFVSISDGKLHKETSSFLTACAVGFFITICLSVFALWPLQGKRGKLQKPLYRSRPSAKIQEKTTIELWQNHYESHRHRAVMKAARVSLTLIMLSLSIILAGLAILKNQGAI